MSFPPLNALRAFEAIARLGSFRAAAEALCVTQSAVSHQVRHLEDWLGGPLFERGGNRPRLLPHGEDLARALSLSLSEIDAACQRARSRRESQPLVIAAIPSIAICWLIPRLSDFRARHPEVEIRLVYALHGRDVDFRDVHLAFVFAAKPPERLGVRAEPFLPGISVPVCAPTLLHRLGKDRPEPLDLLDLGLLHDTDVSGWRSWMTRAGQAGAIPTGGPVFEDFNLLRAAALAGQGVALCPLAMIRPDLEAGRLVQLSDRTVLEDLGYWLLSGPAAGTVVAREAEVFRDWAFATRGSGES
ncbi:LysR family transcriptional regulator [Rubellimicrobium rubrum]|uniref:LysR family transcriptional regulator n=1 Tax=Rubellimicrobium rubrum TaxID=2585369 RepID=A0A5C4N815_9RHOB|nr:LysR substrate-binding domain-containing protein [Rubellimicrobium rubrum]TNC52375.1 LysR family transcriptional regulator [Rubellimicrobium rubrum]